MPAIFPFQTTSQLLMWNGLSGRPITQTNHSLGKRKGERVGAQRGRAGERRGSIRADHSWLLDEHGLQMRLPQSVSNVFVPCWRGRGGHFPGTTVTGRLDGTQLADWLVVSHQGLPLGLWGHGLLDTATRRGCLDRLSKDILIF